MKYPVPPPFVKWSSKLTYEVLRTVDFKDGNTLGECRSQPPQIIIKEGQTSRAEFSCFVHELMHLISFETDAKLTEAQVLKLEKGIMRLLIQNKWI